MANVHKAMTKSTLVFAAATLTVLLTPAVARAGDVLVATDPATNIVMVTAPAGDPGHGHGILLEDSCMQTDEGTECGWTWIEESRDEIQVSESSEEPCRTHFVESIVVVACPPSTQGLIVNFGDEGDYFWSDATLPTTVYGGGGDDDLTGGVGPDTLFGEAGSDRLASRAGGDTLSGGEGDDILSSPTRDGPDEYFGGEGNDLLTYEYRAAGVTVSLDDQANDGGRGEGDNARRDIESLAGTASDDTLIGNSFSNTLAGLAGKDTLKGWAGDDFLEGNRGADDLYGGGGSDEISGANGDDDLFGGGKGDLLRGQAGDDQLYGGAGDDALDGGADADICRQGDGRGTVINCEA